MSYSPSVVSDSYIYEPKDRAPDGHSYRTNWQSEAADYELGGIIRIPISQVERGFINVENSWLNLSISDVNIAGTGIVADAIKMSYIGGSACFDQVNLISGGSYISHQTQYQSIYALNFLNNTDVNNSLTNSITNNSTKPESGANGTLFDAMEGNALPVTLTGTTAAVQTGTLTMSIPLMGILNGEKAIPLGLLTQESVIELYLTNDIKNIFFNAAANGTITGLGSATFTANFDAMIEVVSPNAFREIKAASGGNNGIVTWSSTEQRASSNTILQVELNSDSLMEKQMLVTGVKPRKLLSIVSGCFRDNSQGNYDKWSVVQPWDKTNSGLQWAVGTMLYPPRRIANDSEILKHVQACFNQENYTTQSNRYAQTAFSNRIHSGSNAALAKTNIVRSSCGLDFTSFDKEADGVDVSAVNILVSGNLKRGLVDSDSNYSFVSVKRFGVLYSISESGDWSVSY
jgi:hypothetical protein